MASDSVVVMSVTMTTMIFMLLLPAMVNSRLLESEELLIGEWKTAIRCSPSYFSSELFPPRKGWLQSKNGHNEGLFRFWTPARNFPCRLSVYPNGTFHMEPAVDSNLLDPLSINGKWKIMSNPYCATDRFYDQIIFNSYPRLQKEKTIGGSLSKSPPRVLQNVTLTFQSRLYGHHSAGRIRFGKFFARGKMTHGILVVQRDRLDVKSNKFCKGRHPRVAASFSAKRLIRSKVALDAELDEYDEVQFGY